MRSEGFLILLDNDVASVNTCLLRILLFSLSEQTETDMEGQGPDSQNLAIFLNSRLWKDSYHQTVRISHGIRKMTRWQS